MLLGEGVSHLNSLAKCAVAFFKMPRSIRTQAISAFKRLISVCSWLIGLTPSRRVNRPAASALIQLLSVWPEIPGEALTSDRHCPPRTRRTASFLNSNVQTDKNRFVFALLQAGLYTFSLGSSSSGASTAGSLLVPFEPASPDEQARKLRSLGLCVFSVPPFRPVSVFMSCAQRVYTPNRHSMRPRRLLALSTANADFCPGCEETIGFDLALRGDPCGQ